MVEEDIDTLLENGIKEAEKEKEREKDKKESSSSSSSRARDRDRNRDRDRDRNRDRDRSRSSDRHRRTSSSRSKRRSRSHDRSSRRSRRSSRSRSRDRSRRSSRRRSRSRSHSHTSSRRRKRRASRSSSRSRRRRSSSGDRKRSKSPSQPKEPETPAEAAERERQREMMELTRDHRTVFVGQLQRKVTERDLKRAFCKIGDVQSVLIIKDKFTNRSKGFAYVEMSKLEDVPKILILNGQVPEFQVFPIMVKASEAEKNFAAKKEAAAATVASSFSNASGVSGSHPYPHHPEMSAISSMHNSSAAARIYCGNLHVNITEGDLQSVFESFGEVVSVTINRDETGRSKGFAFIQFRTSDEANFALAKGNGLELAGNSLKLGCVNDNGGATQQSSWKLDDDEGSGLQMNSQSRTALMAKLAGGSGASFIGASNTAPKPVSKPPPPKAHVSTNVSAEKLEIVEGTPSFCFVMKNMFDPSSESGDEWHVEIKEDVEEECSKFGKILHCYVEKDKPGGLVYVLFDRKGGAIKAAETMHGRWFSCRQVLVRYLSSQEYVGMFPSARSAVQEAKRNESS